MTDIVLTWSPDDFMSIGIVAGFFLGCVSCLFVLFLCHVQECIDEWMDNRKKRRQDLNRDFGSDKK